MGKELPGPVVMVVVVDVTRGFGSDALDDDDELWVLREGGLLCEEEPPPLGDTAPLAPVCGCFSVPARVCARTSFHTSPFTHHHQQITEPLCALFGRIIYIHIHTYIYIYMYIYIYISISPSKNHIRSHRADLFGPLSVPLRAYLFAL